MITAGIDAGSSTIKCVLVQSAAGAPPAVVARRNDRIRKRDPLAVAEESFHAVLSEAGVSSHEVAYVATTGEGEGVPFATGHFFGMTTHARGALHLDPSARGALDVGALHGRAVLMDERSKVLGYHMTSQCASGTGQFLENIARYLGIALAELGELSLRGTDPEKPSGICAVLAETDVINMVSRGIKPENIVRGIHLSMADRYARLIKAAKIHGPCVVTGGLAADRGLMTALREEIAKQGGGVELRTFDDSPFAGAIGAALWGAFRHGRLAERGAA